MLQKLPPALLNERDILDRGLLHLAIMTETPSINLVCLLIEAAKQTPGINPTEWLDYLDQFMRPASYYTLDDSLCT